MVNWFEKAKEILQNEVNGKNDIRISLFEDFFDILMVNINFINCFVSDLKYIYLIFLLCAIVNNYLHK